MRKRSETLRNHILQVASRLFYEKGIRNVGIDEIIKESGIARMTLYNHFGSKDQLTREYLRRSSQEWLETYESKIAAASDDPSERLLAAFSVLDDWFRTPTFRGCWITNATVEMPGSEPIKEARDQYHADLRALFFRLAQEAEASNPEELSELLLVVHRGAITSAMVESDPAAADRAREAARSILGPYLPTLA